MMLKSGCKVFLYLVAFLCAGAAAAQATPLVAQTVSTQGFIKGQAVLVEVLVAAPAGTDAQTLNATATAAARKEGVEVSDDFTTLFGVWPQFFDKTGKNNATTLFYNPSSDPVSGALSAFRADLVAWSSVADSTFRYAFGGLTTRTPTVGDGFNDVAFVRTSGNCDFGCALGTTTSLFNIKTGVLLEADIKLYVYSGMPSMWSTNPSVPGTFDIGTVLLHELGHLAGLGHNTDPASLMYGHLGFNEVKQLGAAENSALAFLYHPQPTSLASTSTPSDKHNFNLIAALDSPAPGGGTYVDHFELGSRGVNKNGDVVFAADVDNPGSEVLFETSKGGVTRLLSPGQTVSGLAIGDHTISYSTIDDVGGVAVVWTTYPGDYRDGPYGIDSAVLRKTANGAFQAVVVPRVTSAPGGGWFYGAVDAALSQAGDVAFLGLVDSPFGIRAGVFVAQANGSIVAVARPGDPAPGGGLFKEGWNDEGISIASQGGYVAFKALTTNAVGKKGIFLSDPKAGQLVRIAAIGDAAIGGGTILDVTAPEVNSKGDVLFGAVTSLKFGYLPQRDLYLYSGGTLKAVARRGDVLPDSRIFQSAVSGQWSLTDEGDFAVEARAPSSQSSSRSGYYATWNGKLEYIVRDYDTILNAGVLRLTDTVSMGGHGDVVFSAANLFTRTESLIRASRKVYGQ